MIFLTTIMFLLYYSAALGASEANTIFIFFYVSIETGHRSSRVQNIAINSYELEKDDILQAVKNKEHNRLCYILILITVFNLRSI